MTKTKDEIDLSSLIRSTTKSILDAVGMRLVEANPMRTDSNGETRRESGKDIREPR